VCVCVFTRVAAHQRLAVRLARVLRLYVEGSNTLMAFMPSTCARARACLLRKFREQRTRQLAAVLASAVHP
jgi:hypothetical protein